MKIGYLDEKPQEYAAMLKRVKTLSELKEAVKEFEPIAWDAHDLIQKWDERDYKHFRKMESLERRGVYSEDKETSIVLMPETMFRVSIVQVKFHVPWGTAFIRMKEVGLIEEKKGRFYGLDKPSKK